MTGLSMLTHNVKKKNFTNKGSQTMQRILRSVSLSIYTRYQLTFQLGGSRHSWESKDSQCMLTLQRLSHCSTMSDDKHVK